MPPRKASGSGHSLNSSLVPRGEMPLLSVTQLMRTFCQPTILGMMFNAPKSLNNTIMQNNSTPTTATEAMKARFIFHIIDAPRDSSYVYDHKTLAQILTQKEEPGLASYDEFTLKPGDEVLVEDLSYVVDSIRFRMYGGMLGTTPEVGINLYGIGEPSPFNVEVVAMLRNKD